MRLVSDSSARGSVLLLTLVVTGLIAMVSLSFGATVEARVEVAREEAASLRTELAAQSALEWARRQLALDPEWKGTDGSLLLDEDLRLYFKVERLDGASSSWEPTEVSLDLEGSGTRSLTRLTANLSVDPGDPLRSAALSVLGGDFRARNLSVDGDLLVLDQPGLLWNPVRATGRPHRGDRHFQGRRLADGTMGKGRPWAQAPPMPWPVIEIFRLDISGCALKSFGSTSAVARSGPPTPPSRARRNAASRDPSIPPPGTSTPGGKSGPMPRSSTGFGPCATRP